jgi:hypothetical protein
MIDGYEILLTPARPGARLRHPERSPDGRRLGRPARRRARGGFWLAGGDVPRP